MDDDVGARGRGPLPGHVRVAVVGSSFAGIGAAIGLLRSGVLRSGVLRSGARDQAPPGIDELVVLERADELGGTWRDNTYPGCACDVPSHLYSFSFAPNPGWTRRYAPRAEIQDYLRRTATAGGVDAHLRLGADVLGCRWDAGARHWVVTTTLGTLTADVVVSAGGPLSEPHVPDLEGLAGFAGPVVHSARWDPALEVSGRRVAVLGTGASAAQLVPPLARDAAHLSVFQRSAPWVLPRGDRPTSPRERAVFRRVPAAQVVVRAALFCALEPLVLGFSGRTRLLERVERLARRFLARSVSDPGLRARLTPDSSLGCKRVVLSDDWYPTLTRPDVAVVTDPVVRVVPTGLVTRDAAGAETEHPVDAIVLCTGFTVTDPPLAHGVVGADGRTLAEHWAGGMRAHLGMTVSGFPNLVHLVGPNTGLGHSSIVVMVESQVRYLVDLLRRMDAAGVATVEPHAQVEQEWDDDVQTRLARSVWASGCASWYLDATGRNSTLWPRSTLAYRRLTRRARLADHRVTSVS